MTAASRSPDHRDRRARWAWPLLWLAAFGCFGWSTHGTIENTDTDVTMIAARAWYERGDPGMRADAERPAERWLAGQMADDTLGILGRNGLGYAQYPIGHQALLVPFVAIGQWLGERWPEPVRRYAELRGPVMGDEYWVRFCVGMSPALFAAGCFVLLVSLAMALGCRRAEALVVGIICTLCTQFWPGTAETMSDMPGGFFLLAMACGVAHAIRGGTRSWWLPWLAGTAGGCAVLVRYPHGALVAVLSVLFAFHAWRSGRASRVLALVAGGLPWAALLLWANHWRFGDALATGYGPGMNDAWASFPPLFGIPAMLLAPGKGVLLFSLPLIWALALTITRRARGGWVWSAWLCLALPVGLLGHTSSWAAGQCWGIRYVTPSAVLVICVVLGSARPWRWWSRRHAGMAIALCAAGFIGSLGGVLAPYRGQQVLATEAAKVVYPDAGLAIDHNVNTDPRFSPLHTHWIYAGLALQGRLQQGGAENTTLPLFGVRVEPAVARLPIAAEDAGFRHWWMVLGTVHFGWPGAWLAAIWALVTAACGAMGVRALLADRGTTTRVASARSSKAPATTP